MSTSAKPIQSVSSAMDGVWSNVCSKVNKAVVFMDNASAECVHWAGGLSRLLDAGAVDVREFSSFESGDEEQKKAVFIVSTVLLGETREILHDVITASHFQYCVLVTALSPSTHLFAAKETTGSEDQVFQRMEYLMTQWMGNIQFTAEVLHFPICAISICPGLFVMPQHAFFSPLLSSDVDKLKESRKEQGDRMPVENLNDIDFGILPHELQVKIKVFVSSLNSLLQELRISDDCYGVGHMSKLCATQLANHPAAKNRRKNMSNKASLILIDRTLDLAGAAGHHSDCMADKIFALLPRLPHHTNDVAVDMSSLLSLNTDTDAEDMILPGCIAHPNDNVAKKLLFACVTAKQKECLMDVNRQLVDAISREKLPLKRPVVGGRVTAKTLDSHLNLFKGNLEAFKKNSGLLQVASACTQTLAPGGGYAGLENLLGVEKVLLQNLDDDEAALNQIMQLLQDPNNTKGVSVEGALALLVFVYSLLGTQTLSDMAQEKQLQSDLTQAILSVPEAKRTELLQEIVEDDFSEVGVRAAVDKFFTRLRGVSQAREQLKQFNSIFESGSTSQPAAYKPILKQIVDEIFDPSKPELVDIEYKSSGLKDLLKTGFSLFMNVSKPKPSDHSVLIVYVIGGITCAEVKMVTDTVAAHNHNTQVLIGSTNIVTPKDIVKQTFGRSPLDSDNI